MKFILSPPFCFHLFLIIICLVFSCDKLDSQVPVIDNLKFRIQNGKEDTIKIKNLNELSSEYVDLGMFEEATMYGQQALRLSQKLKSPSGMFAAYINLGNVDSDIGRNEDALKHYGLALDVSKLSKDKRSEAICMNNAGLVYYNTGKI
ncbi:MAG: tetratricopeptide repeat protein [Saprospiraceae bacterium]|nr:tetratricopeptide repeat protein [Candidatus Opimibacter skivensis]